MDGHTALSDDQRFAAIGGSHDVGDGVTALPWDSGSPSALASTLVEWVRQSSISGTAGERRFGERLLETVRSLPYFRCHRDQVHALRAEGNWQPPVIVAWVKGRAGTPRGHRRPVVVLAGHYDTVGVQDFLARGLDPFDAEAIAIYFRTGQVGREHSRAAAPHRGDHNGAPATGHEGLVEVPMVVHAAACSGQYVFGRGALDMKAGLVASLAALERLSARASELPGDVVWIATPDEENLSRGAIAAAAWLDRWLEEQEATCVALINADYVTGDPAAAPAYFGALGKLLPSFVVIGLPTHVGDPLAGLDPITVAAEIVREVSLHPAFQEDLSMPPPVPLQLRDLKEAYNVQTAPTAAGYFNLYFPGGRPGRSWTGSWRPLNERCGIWRGDTSSMAASCPSCRFSPFRKLEVRLETFTNRSTLRRIRGNRRGSESCGGWIGPAVPAPPWSGTWDRGAGHPCPIRTSSTGADCGGRFSLPRRNSVTTFRTVALTPSFPT